MLDATDGTALTALEAAERIAAGEMSAEEYAGVCLDRIAAIEGTVHAFAHLDPDAALAEARKRDEHRRSGGPLGPLHGVPVAVKDIFDTRDYPTECGSPILRGRRPSRDATAVARLREAGAVIIGKTVTTEFAYYHPGPTRNPHDVSRTPGGSSSGSAAAVAAAMVPLAIGSQTNGSVIRPAAFCGVYGCKPTHGTISRSGALMLSRTLDHVGTFARSLADTALLLDVLAGYDRDDADTRSLAVPDFVDLARDHPPAPPRFAFVRTPVWDEAGAEMRAALEDLAASLGDQAQEFALPAVFAAAWSDHRTLMAVDMAHNLLPTVSRGGDAAASAALREIIAEGGRVNALRYLTARENINRYAASLSEVFRDFDAILTPPVPGIAPQGEATGSPAFCSLWTLTGLPAITLPLLHGEGGMPLGVQLVGARGDDGRLLRTANWLVQWMES